MSIFSKLSLESIAKIKTIRSSEYEEPQFKLGQVPFVADIDATPKEIQNWTNRGFITPAQNAPRKTRLYSLENAVKARVIWDLTQSGPFQLAEEIGSAVAHRGGRLLAEGYDFFEQWESGQLMVYYYALDKEGFPRGVSISRPDLAKVILGEKKIPGVIGHEKRIYEADETIFYVLATYATGQWRI